MFGGLEYCTYYTPCGWCSKWDKKCDKKIPGQGERVKCNPIKEVFKADLRADEMERELIEACEQRLNESKN